MWKKRIAILGIGCVAFLAAGVPVYAGGINAAEQRIIDYYNGVFVYNGKSYVFTESAKAAAYDKLASDDVDLSEAEASSAIRQGRSKLKQGIDEGYLVEVGGTGSGDDGDDTQPGDGQGNPGDGDGSGDNTGNGDGSGDNTGNGDGTGNNTGNGGGPGDNSGNGDGSGGNSGNGGSPGGNGDGSGSNTGSNGGSLGGNTGNGGAGDNSGSGDGLGNHTGGNGGGSGDNSGNGSHVPPNPKKIDVDSLLQEVGKDQEHNPVFGLQDADNPQDAQITGSSFTAEQYLEGKAIAVTKNGEVLLEADLPIKNTGFYNGGMKQLAIIAGAVFVCVMLAAALLAKSKKRKKAIGYLGVPLIFSVLLAGAFGLLLSGGLEDQLGKWKSIWIAGAPGYAYAQGMGDTPGRLPTEGKLSPEDITLPLPGDQYGELACEEAGLQAPLYYGDSKEVLEQGAGTYAGGYLPGMGGTILVGAHDATFFGSLEAMGEGDVVSLETAYGKFQYSVTKTQVADIMDVSAYGITDEEEGLILYTCYPFGVEDRVRNQRFYVYAEKISGPEIGE